MRDPTTTIEIGGRKYRLDQPPAGEALRLLAAYDATRVTEDLAAARALRARSLGLRQSRALGLNADQDDPAARLDEQADRLEATTHARASVVRWLTDEDAIDAVVIPTLQWVALLGHPEGAALHEAWETIYQGRIGELAAVIEAAHEWFFADFYAGSIEASDEPSDELTPDEPKAKPPRKRRTRKAKRTG